MNRNSIRLFWLALIAIGIGQTVLAAPTRVALVQTDADPRARNVRDLAEALLAEGGDIRCLERQNVERILAEQRLSLSGLVSAQTAVAVGKVLPADLLAIIESDANSAGDALIIFDPGTGVRLWDAALAGDDAAKAADAVVRCVRDAAVKRANLLQLHTVCLMAVRNGDLPRDMDGFCDAVGRLMERRLVGSSSVALLERSRLEQVEKERAISPAAAERDLLATLMTLELEIDRGKAGNALQATAILSNGVGKSLGKLTMSVREMDPVALALALAEGLDAQFKLNVSGQMDRQAEAARFYRESLVRSNSSHYGQAIAAAEAAHALVPDNRNYHAMLARSLVDSALPSEGRGTGRIRAGPVPGAFKRGAAMIGDIFPLTNNQAALAHLENAADQIRRYIEAAEFDRLRLSREHAPEHPDIAEVKESLRRYVLAKDAVVFAAISNGTSRRHYTVPLLRFVADDQWLCCSSAEWSQDFQHVAEQWLVLHTRFPNLAESVRAALKNIACGWKENTFSGQMVFPLECNRKPRPADYARLKELEQIMRGDSDWAIRKYADLLGLAIAVKQIDGRTEEMKRYVDEYVGKLKAELDRPENKNRVDVRDVLYELMGLADELLDLTPLRGMLSQELFEFAIARKELPDQIVYRIVDGNYLSTSEKRLPTEFPQRIAAIERVLAVSKLPGARWLPVDRADLYRRELQTYKRSTGDVAAEGEVKAWWTHSRRLIDLFDNADGMDRILNPLVVGDSIYALELTASASLRDSVATLLRVPIDGRPIVRLGSLPTNFRMLKTEPSARSLMFFGNYTRFLATCFGEGRYCAATLDSGILIFPVDGSPPQRLDEKSGLPTSSTQALAILDGKLYAALGYPGQDSYVASYDLASKQVEILASNARKDKRSPFDDGVAFEIPGLIADAPRHRLIVIIQRYEPTTQVNGIWEYTPAGGKWRQLLPMRLLLRQDPRVKHWVQSRIERVGVPWQGMIPISLALGVLNFDLEKDQALSVFQMDFKHTETPIPLSTIKLQYATPAGAKAAYGLWPNFYRWAYIEPWLYSGGSSWSRVNVKTGQIDRSQSLRDNTYRFCPSWLQPLDDGRLLVGDGYGLWILTFPQGDKAGAQEK